MPLVRIDVTAGRSADELARLTGAVHDAIVEVYGIPPRDRFQIVTEHPVGHIVAEDAGLGFERTDGVVMIQIFTQRGRSDEAKSTLFSRIHDALHSVDVASEDVFIGYIENGPQDWSFGFGRSQYVTGELGVPALQ